MTNSISGDSNPKRITNLKEFQTENPEVKNSKQINSVFEQLDTNKDGILQKEEGEVFLLNNGGVYAQKNGKAAFGITENGNMYKYNDEGKPEAIKPKSDFIMSTKHRNTKVAQYDNDGNLRTSFVPGDSFEGTMIRLGLDPSDKEVRKAMEEANPEAAKRKRFVLEDDGDKGTQVKIPKAILDKYEVRALTTAIRLYKKAEEKQADTIKQESAKEEYAKKLAGEWKTVEVQSGIPDPFKSVAPVVENAEPAGRRDPYKAVAPFIEKAIKKAAEQKNVKTADETKVAKKDTKSKKEIKAEQAEAKKLEAEKKAEEKRIEAERKAEAERLEAEKKTEEKRVAEERKAAKTEARVKAAEAKEAEKAKKAKNTQDSAPAKYTVNEEFRNKVKNMKTGLAFTPKYSIDENGNVNKEVYEKQANIRTSDFAKLHPLPITHMKPDEKGLYHRGTVVATVPAALNVAYNKTVNRFAIDTAIYQDLSKKESLTDGEKAFIQRYEKEMCEFINAK